MPSATAPSQHMMHMLVKSPLTQGHPATHAAAASGTSVTGDFSSSSRPSVLQAVILWVIFLHALKAPGNVGMFSKKIHFLLKIFILKAELQGETDLVDGSLCNGHNRTWTDAHVGCCVASGSLTHCAPMLELFITFQLHLYHLFKGTPSKKKSLVS